MISTVILSKNKAPQLRLLLDSLQINGGNLFDITVLYEYTDDLFLKGYIKTQNHFYNKNLYDVNFPIKWRARHSSNLSHDISGCLSSGRDLTCIFNDENILFNRVASYTLIKKLFDKYRLSTLSLRLGNNTVIQNPYERQDYFAPLPKDGEFAFDKFLVWNASVIDGYTNFAMPFSTSGHIYKKNVILNVLKHSPIGDFEDFEKIIQDKLYSGDFGGNISPLMSCLEYSAVIQNALVKLTETEESNLDVSPASANARYLKGNTIDYFSFDFSHVSKPYQEFLVSFHNENNLHNSS